MQFCYAYGIKSMPPLVEATIHFLPEYSLVVMITRGESGRHTLQQSQHHHIWVQIKKNRIHSSIQSSLH